MHRFGLPALCLLSTLLFPRVAWATKSAELYSSSAYGYGRFEARMRVTAGDGVVSAFFLWKDGSEQAGAFWNELDFEKIGATCQLQTNALFGTSTGNHTQKPTVSADLCADFHVYAFEWTADSIAWFLDGTEIRRETGDIAAAYADNASAGMAMHFNVWPGDSSFGGNFDPSILPVHQYIDWAQYSSYANGAFTLAWREDFSGATAPSGWLTGDWGSPKNLSTHDPRNVNFLTGYAVLSLTSDDATGPAGAMGGPDTGMGGLSGTGGVAGGTSAGGAPDSAGSGPGATGGASPAGGTNSTGGMNSAGGTNSTGGTSGTAATTGGSTGTGATGPTGTGGAVSGGASGSTGSGGSAGVPGGNSGATGGTPSAGGAPTGNPGAGGAQAMAGASADDGATANGCGCRVTGTTRDSRSEASLGAALLLALAGAVRRRRARRAADR